VKVLVTQPSATSGLAGAGLVRYIKDGVTKMYRLFHTFGTEVDGEVDEANVADLLKVDALLSRPLILSEVEQVMKDASQSFGVNYSITFNQLDNTPSLTLSKGYTSLTLSSLQIEFSANEDYDISLVSTSSQGGEYNQKFRVANLGEVNKPVTVYIAAYGERGQVLALSSDSKSITAKGTEIFDVSIPYIANAKYRFFVWEDGYSPLAVRTSID
jgi:hypothetical protein